MSAADFTLIRPITMTDTIVGLVTIFDLAAAAIYSAGTTYALGQIVGRTGGDVTKQLVYKSLQASNTGHTPESSPTWWVSLGTGYSEYDASHSYNTGDTIGVHTGHAQTVYTSLQTGNTGHTPASSPTWWESVGTVYDHYDATVTYAANDIVTSVATNSHLLYSAVVGSNTGQALTDTTKWLPYGPTNAWAPFDATYGSQAIWGESFQYVITPGQVANSIYFGNLNAASVRVQQSVSGYDTTFQLNQHNVLDWYSWFYEPVVRKTDLPVTGLPPYPASFFTITVSNPGDVAKCGLIFTGQSVVIGLTQWELLGGILSYSGTSTDRFGNTTFAAIANAKKLNFDVRVTPGFESEAYRIMKQYTDTPMVIVCSSDYAMASAYGYFYSWQVPVTDKGKNMAVEFRGLI